MHQFDTDISCTRTSPESWKGDISDNWSINGVPNGGYLMAIMANAMLQDSGKRATPVITANFMARSTPGDVSVSVAKMSQSTQFERYEARLSQGDQETIRAFGTFVQEQDTCRVDRYEAGPPELAPREACVMIPELPKFTVYRHMDVLLDPACAGWMMGTLVDRSENKGWIRFKEKRPYDIPALLFAADAFPPPIMASQGMVAWVPTLEFSVNIRNLPRSEWLKCIFRTRFVTCGLLEEDGEIWDETGALVAVSRQIAQFRSYA